MFVITSEHPEIIENFSVGERNEDVAEERERVFPRAFEIERFFHRISRITYYLSRQINYTGF